jgi:hypothetical protein
MATLKDIERVFFCQNFVNQSPPFPTTLTGTHSLCKVTINARRAGYLVRAQVNWSAIFTPLVTPSPLVLTTPGFAVVEFRLLRDGGPIERKFQTAGQVGFTIGGFFNVASTTFEIAALQVLDTSSIGGVSNPLSTFEIEASVITLSPPFNVDGLITTPIGTTTVAAGAVSLVVEEIDSCRAEALSI